MIFFFLFCIGCKSIKILFLKILIIEQHKKPYIYTYLKTSLMLNSLEQDQVRLVEELLHKLFYNTKHHLQDVFYEFQLQTDALAIGKLLIQISVLPYAPQKFCLVEYTYKIICAYKY